MSEGRVVGPVWWGFVRPGTEHGSLAGYILWFYLRSDPLPRERGWDGGAASHCCCRPVPAQADMGPVCCKPNSLKKQNLQGNRRIYFFENCSAVTVEAERLLGVGLLNADLTELVSTAAHDGWKHEVRAEAAVRPRPGVSWLCLRIITSNIRLEINCWTVLGAHPTIQMGCSLISLLGSLLLSTPHSKRWLLWQHCGEIVITCYILKSGY